MNTTSDQADIVFRYYEEQWNHVRHHENLRSKLTVQVVVFVGLIAWSFLNLKLNDSEFSLAWVRLAMAWAAFIIGLTGCYMAWITSKASQNHIRRARAARKRLEFLETFNKTEGRFPSMKRAYLLINAIAALVGAALVAFTFYMHFWPQAPSKPAAAATPITIEKTSHATPANPVLPTPNPIAFPPMPRDVSVPVRTLTPCELYLKLRGS